MSDVETLRKAAALIRERANAATQGPWSLEQDWAVVASGSDSVIHGYYEGTCPACDEGITDTASVALQVEDAQHIASWHPAVALAVADWLDSVRAPDDPHTLAEAESKRCRLCAEYHRALAVARAYLGRDS